LLVVEVPEVDLVEVEVPVVIELAQHRFQDHPPLLLLLVQVVLVILVLLTTLVLSLHHLQMVAVPLSDHH
tara:strand:- start:576 stop:785 length:210 start_codon:yes stop_codon:yes gene_type:complete